MIYAKKWQASRKSKENYLGLTRPKGQFNGKKFCTQIKLRQNEVFTINYEIFITIILAALRKSSQEIEIIGLC